MIKCLIDPTKRAAVHGCHCEKCEECRAYHQAYRRAWYAIPANREKVRVRNARPENRKRKRAYDQAYYARPEVRKRQRKYNRVWQAKPENREKQRAYYANIRHQAMSLVGNGVIKCIYCGCDEPTYLEFNHKNGGGYQEQKMGRHSIKRYNRIIRDPEYRKQFELTCHPCNSIHYLKLQGKGDWTVTWKPIGGVL